MSSETSQESLQCVNCGINLKQIRRRWMSEESEELRQLLSDWTCKELEDNDAICLQCYPLLHLALESGNKLRRLGHKEICLPCGKSILRTRRESLSSHPEYKLAIAQWTPSHQVKHLESVCWRCYSKARRLVEITNTEVPAKISKIESQGIEVKIERLESVLGYGELDIPASPDSQSEKDEVPDTNPQPYSISLDNYKRAADTASRCIFKHCKYSDRLTIPRSIKERLLIDYSFFIPSHARICTYHQINSHKEWSDLVNSSSITDFTAAHLEDLFSILKNTKCNMFCKNFDNLIKRDNFLCQYLLGTGYKKYGEMLKDIEPIRKNVWCLKKALAMYLMRKHTGFSNEKVARFFGVSVKLLVMSINRVHAHLETIIASDDSYVAIPTVGDGDRKEIVYYRV